MASAASFGRRMRDVASKGGGEYLSALSLEETGEVGDR